MNNYVLGDIHGAYKSLKQVLEKSKFDYENDRLIFLGDVVDGWSETDKCIEELMKIKNLVFIRGNHDQWAIDFYSGKMRKTFSGDWASWQTHGGRATYECYGETMPENHLEFLKSSIYYYEFNNSLFIHGGFNPRKKIKEQDQENLCWDRWLVQHVYENQLKKTVHIEGDPKHYNEIYVGHTPLQSFRFNSGQLKFDVNKPQRWANVNLMDTGCAFKGVLSLMNLDTKELFSSEFSMILYPDERGRNDKTFKEMTK